MSSRFARFAFRSLSQQAGFAGLRAADGRPLPAAPALVGRGGE